jgi:tetratricopeptide (TPR) repeat protein
MQLPQDYAFAFLGDAYLAYGGVLVESGQRNEVLAQAEEALQNARALNPLNPEHTLRLADLHLTWASLVSSHADKEGHFRTSLDYYAQAIRLSPHILNMAPFSDRYARALREYSAFLAKPQAAPSVPSP